MLEVLALSQVSTASITDADALRAGSSSAGRLRSRLDAQGQDSRVWRVEFKCVGEDDRIARRNDSALNSEKLAKLQSRLKRMDGASSTGAWTEKTLQLIAAHPGVVSTRLAERMKMERQAFKIKVRKLKDLGLTESLEIGYRLSPLGEAFLRVRP